jgi:hypothetical protein
MILSRHAFQEATPFISRAMWSGLAMRAKSFRAVSLKRGGNCETKRGGSVDEARLMPTPAIEQFAPVSA